MDLASFDLDNNQEMMKIMGFCQLGHQFENKEENEGKRNNFLS